MNIEITQIDDSPFVEITGKFYRSIDAAHINHILSGSTQPGRYSTINQRTLYLSASKEGVAVAMIAHQPASPKDITKLHVTAENILDLRDAGACGALGITPKDARGPWQELVQQGIIPPSQILANRLRDLGAYGLIDPSRKAPGLWHLVLFKWNDDDSSVVSITNTLPPAKTLL